MSNILASEVVRPAQRLEKPKASLKSLFRHLTHGNIKRTKNEQIVPFNQSEHGKRVRRTFFPCLCCRGSDALEAKFLWNILQFGPTYTYFLFEFGPL